MEHFNWLTGFVFPYINFFIFAAVLIIWVRPAAARALKQKREAFEKLLLDSQRARQQAEEQSRVLKHKLANLDTEINQILANAKKSAEVEAQLILKNAKEFAEHIKTEAKRMAQAEVDTARSTIRADIINEVAKQVESKFSKDVNDSQHVQVISNRLSTLKKLGSMRSST